MKTPDDEIGTTAGLPGELSTRRLWVLRAGLLTLAVGFLMFLWTFVEFAINFGNFDEFEERGRRMALLAIGGFVLIFVGIATAIAAGSGLAGALWHLDPRRAERRLRPWARLSGRLTDEAFSEMKTVRQSLAGFSADADADAPTERIVQVRCRECRALNAETDTYCGRCGSKL